MSDSGDQLSMIDRFLACLDFMECWPSTSILTLSRGRWHKPAFSHQIPVAKDRIKDWLKLYKNTWERNYNYLNSKIQELEFIAETRSLSEGELELINNYRNITFDFEHLALLDIHQKSRVRWLLMGMKIQPVSTRFYTRTLVVGGFMI
ncbi:hypothetical protein Hdeb2414_s0437g00893581 [Helianthus debilis subsp. tardiflorus]